MKAFPTPGDGKCQMPEDKTEARKHDNGLDDIGPDDRLYSPRHGVEGSESNQEK